MIIGISPPKVAMQISDNDKQLVNFIRYIAEVDSKFNFKENEECFGSSRRFHRM